MPRNAATGFPIVAQLKEQVHKKQAYHYINHFHCKTIQCEQNTNSLSIFFCFTKMLIANLFMNYMLRMIKRDANLFMEYIMTSFNSWA